MCRKCVVLHISDICFVQIYTFSAHRANILVIHLSFFECKESFKYTENGLDNPPDNHKGELYETYQYVTAKHHYQESAHK